MKIIEELTKRGVKVRGILKFKESLSLDEKFKVLGKIIPLKTVAFRDKNNNTVFISIVSAKNIRVPENILSKLEITGLEREKKLKRNFNLEKGFVNPISPILQGYSNVYLILCRNVQRNGECLVEITVSQNCSVIISLEDVVLLFRKHNLPIIYI